MYRKITDFPQITWNTCWQTSWRQSGSANKLFKAVSDFINSLPNVLPASTHCWSHWQSHLFWKFSYHITSFVCAKICTSYLFFCDKPPQIHIIHYLMISVGQEFRSSVVGNLWLEVFCEAVVRCWLGLENPLLRYLLDPDVQWPLTTGQGPPLFSTEASQGAAWVSLQNSVWFAPGQVL